MNFPLPISVARTTSPSPPSPQPPPTMNSTSVESEVALTPIKIRIELSRLYESADNHDIWVKKFEHYRDVCLSKAASAAAGTLQLLHPTSLNDLAWNQLRIDVENVFNYRRRTTDDGKITDASLKYWFPSNSFNNSDSNGYTYDYATIQSWINIDYDFIYTSHGLHLLINRYLKPYEPIQCCMLRIAKLFACNDTAKTIDYTLWSIFYRMIACGFLQVSSILADAEQADKTIQPGEACCLMVATKKYDRTFVRQLERVSSIVSLGVGAGISMSTVPLIGRKENGHVHSGFKAIVQKLDSCGLVHIYERRPKIAIYLNAHCDTIFVALEARHPNTKHRVENCFIGLLLSNYFMECVRERQPWYLFPANISINGENLSDFYGDDYASKYKEYVRRKMYSKSLPATKLMEYIVTAIAETGGPYIIYEDHVNMYSNHQHRGKIKTLNLCAEITNYSSDVDIASCTLVSVNFGLFHDFPHELSTIQRYIEELYPNITQFTQSFNGNYRTETAYTFLLGFMGTWALNGLFSRKRQRREIGINPMGVYDMALLSHHDPVDLCAITSEAMYMGAILASCLYHQRYNVTCSNYEHSKFSYGITQFNMRNIEPNGNWDIVRHLMTCGMANSMLTSQSPTATTSQLTGVTASVQLPVAVNEPEPGNVRIIGYGLLTQLLLQPNREPQLDNAIERQIEMYARSAPFIDHSQSTVFRIDWSKQAIFNLIRDTYRAKLKTGIYYVVPLKPFTTTTAATNNTSQQQQQQPQSNQSPVKPNTKLCTCGL